MPEGLLPKLIIFDLDDTLAESKQPLEPEMAELLRKLLQRTQVAIISGAHFERFEQQFLPSLGATDAELKNLILAPTCGGALVVFDTTWKFLYKHSLTEEEKALIHRVFQGHVFGKVYEHPEEQFGDIMEDRDSMIAFAGLGQKAPIAHKSAWDPDQKKRLMIRDAVLPHLPLHEVRIGGASSIDITRKGVDKGYGVQKISEYMGIPLEDMFFVGDALYEGGNDFPVIATGIRVIETNGLTCTKETIQEFLKSS